MKTRFDAEGVVVSRVFEREDGAVWLSLYKPIPYPKPEIDADPDDPPWRCSYAIEFPDGETKHSYAVGIDGMQALLLAIASAAGAMRYVGDGTSTKRPPVRWLGAGDLGLSIDNPDY